MRNKLWIAPLALAFALGACDDMLVEEPKDFLSTANYYQTPEQMEVAVQAGYGSLRSIYPASHASWWGAIGLLTDQETVHPTEVNAARNPDFYLNTAESNQFGGAFANSYTGIYRMNLVLSRIDDVEMPEARLTALKAEAQMLRAFFYLNLDRLYSAGPNLNDLSVPLILTEEGHADHTVARATVSEVHAAIIADLTAAEANLPTRTQRGAAGRGRVTKGAAQMALADLYLWRSSYHGQNEWQQASDAAKRVIDSNQYSLVQTGFFNVFNPQTKAANNENIFFWVATGTQGRSTSAFVNAHAPRDLGFNIGGGFGVNRANPAFVASYIAGDVRGVLGKGTLVAGMFPNDTVAYRNYACSTGVNFEGSKREGPSNHFCGPLPYSSVYPYKFRPSALPANRGDVDVPLYRYAETLLMYAEAQNELGNTAVAAQYVNLVRARARRGSTGSENRAQPADISAALSKLQMREAIFQERSWELAHEQPKRWLDLVRRDRMEPGYWYAAVSKDVNSNAILPDLAQRQYLLRFPIPQDEIDVNNNLVQNPGY